MVTENYINVTNLINRHSNLINKIKTERINDNWILDVFLKRMSLHIFISNNIKVDINQSLNQYILDFSRDERIFETYDQFEVFFLNIVDGYKEESEGLYVEYNGEKHLCHIEITHIDPDRQMGPETHYELSITGEDGEQIIVADVSEYPMASFSVFVHDDEFQSYQQEIEQYFFNKSTE